MVLRSEVSFRRIQPISAGSRLCLEDPGCAQTMQSDNNVSHLARTIIPAMQLGVITGDPGKG